MSKAASEGSLSEVHSMTAELMKRRLDAALAGEEQLAPAELAVIVKFLKDNNIECTRDDMRQKFGQLLEYKGPEFDEVEEKYG